MKLRIRLLLLFVIVLTLGGLWYSLLNREPAQTFPATVDRDCAPWDGAAFTIQVQYAPATVIHISIWKSPHILLPTIFTFPDESVQVGSAYILPELGPYTLLRGEVRLQRVQEGTPVEGGFSLRSARGETYEGRFTAEWGNQVVYCG